MVYKFNPSTGNIIDEEDGQIIASMSESATPEQAARLVQAYNTVSATRLDQTPWRNGFDPAGTFDSPDEALAMIHDQVEPMKALMALVQAQVDYGECGFASEVVRDFNIAQTHVNTEQASA